MNTFKYIDADKHGRTYLKAVLTDIKNKKPIEIYLNNSSIKTLLTINENSDELKQNLENFNYDILNFLKKTPFLTIDNKRILWTKIIKSPYSGYSTKLNYNKGEVSEGLLGLAISYKCYIGCKSISFNDFLSFHDEYIGCFSHNKTFFINSVDNISQIFLKIKLKKKSLEGFLNKKILYEMHDEIIGILKYVNSSHFEQIFSKSNKKFKIVVDGVSNEKTSKSDVQVFLNDDKIPEISLSLKTGNTKNFEQCGITEQKIKNIFKIFGIDVPLHNPPFSKQEEWYKTTFENVILEWNKNMNTKTLSKAIDYFATKNDSLVDVLHINDRNFNIFSFDKLNDKLSLLKIKAFYDHDKKRPQIYLKDKISDKRLLDIRLEVRGNEK